MVLYIRYTIYSSSDEDVDEMEELETEMKCEGIGILDMCTLSEYNYN